MLEFTMGNSFKTEASSLTSMSTKVTFSPRPSSINSFRKWAISVMSASVTTVNCAPVRRLATRLSAMVRRIPIKGIRLSTTRSPTSMVGTTGVPSSSSSSSKDRRIPSVSSSSSSKKRPAVISGSLSSGSLARVSLYASNSSRLSATTPRGSPIFTLSLTLFSLKTRPGA